MKKIKKLSLVLGLGACFTFSACGSSASNEIDALKEKMCACKDMACVTGLQKELTGMAEKMKGLSPDEVQKAATTMMEVAACAQKAAQQQ